MDQMLRLWCIVMQVMENQEERVQGSSRTDAYPSHQSLNNSSRIYPTEHGG